VGGGTTPEITNIFKSMLWRFKMDMLVNGDASKYPYVLKMELFDFADALRIKEKIKRVEYLQMTKPNSIL
jgi:hypothetical protein